MLKRKDKSGKVWHRLAMISDWVETPLEELRAPNKGAFAMGPFGSRIKVENFVSEGVPVIKGSNLSGAFLQEDDYDYLTEEKAHELASSNAYPLDIVITHRGTIGQVGIIPEGSRFPKYVVSQSQLKLSLNQRLVNPYFVYYFLRSPEGQRRLLMNTSQVGVPAIAQALTSVRRIRIPLPKERKEQEKIVEVFLSLDRKIKINHDMNAVLRQIAQTFFKSWFVNFDPVKAKAAGGQPDGMGLATAAMFPSQFQESDTGPIPRGWKQKRVNELAQVNGWTLRNSDELPRIDYVEISAVNKGDILEIAEYERGCEPSRARRRLRHGDTALSTVRPERGAYFLCLQPSERLIASTGFVVISPFDNWAFMHAALTQDETFKRLGSLADGAAYPAVRPELIAELPLVLPEEGGLIEEFQKIVAPLYQRAETNSKESFSLAKVRDTLLPRLTSGLFSNLDIERDTGGVR